MRAQLLHRGSLAAIRSFACDRQHDNHHEMERSRGAKPSSCFDRIRSDGVRPKARVGSDPAAKSRADGRILEDVRLTAKN